MCLAHVTGYFGVVEPQMRYTEHKHELIQVQGYSNPREFFSATGLVDQMREVFSYAVSISFTSVEAFAAQCGTGDGMCALAGASLMPIQKGQDEKLGAERAVECVKAQNEARGVRGDTATVSKYATTFVPYTSEFHGDAMLPAAEYESRICLESNGGGSKSGNHKCLPKTCYKGRVGIEGFCRMRYYHYGIVESMKKRRRGREQLRWSLDVSTASHCSGAGQVTAYHLC